MCQNDLVSIITPTLNADRYIEETLASINGQLYTNIEHIVVDGGSTDRTLAILSQYENIKTINTNLPGMYAAINIGLKAAKGNILCYLNSDDLLADSDIISRVVSTFNSHPNRNWVYGNCDFIDYKGRFRKRYVAPYFSRHLFSALDGMLICQPATFWRSRCNSLYGFFNEEYRLAADFDFFLRLALSENPVRIGGPALAKFRVHSSSLSARYINESLSEVMRIKCALNLTSNQFTRLAATLLRSAFNTHRIYENWFKV